MKWTEKLTRKELKHLRGYGMRTLSDVQENMAEQARTREKNPGPAAEPCWECRAIARKLGLPIRAGRE